jgi:hypothetical protein
MNAMSTAGSHSIRPVDRLFGLVELMSQHASARLDGYESPRITAAIVGHLRVLADAMPDAPQVQTDANLWLDHWENIAARQSTLRTQRSEHSIFDLLMNFGEARR